MANPNQTILVSLFHTEEHATQALNDLRSAGIPQQSIQSLGGVSSTSAPEQSLAALQGLQLPEKDLRILADGLKSGGKVIVVRADDQLAGKVESIFARHEAGKIDERDLGTNTKAAAAVAAEGVIPVIEEDLVVGKRTVQTGGVRVFSRIVETPVTEQVTLREEHVTIDRHAVNRPISTTELNAFKDQTIEVAEMGEEAVVGKTARVVEEVHVGKGATERTQQIKDTVRRTEVEVDEIPGETLKGAPSKL